jgi:ABC-2 family transporter
MIWLTWRQFRTQTLTGLLLVAAVAAAYAATRPALLDLARSTGFTGCTVGCDRAADAFVKQAEGSYFAQFFYGAVILLWAGPALIGFFWGAPMVARELESGTHRMIWNQSVSRTRWLAVKLAAGGLVTVAVAGLASLAITWWASPLDHAGGWMEPYIFAARGVVPIGYATLAYVIGVAVGMVLRRTVPAMAVTLVLVIGSMVAGPFLLRQHLATPVATESALAADDIKGVMMSADGEASRDITVSAEPPVRGSWVIEDRILGPAGTDYRGPYDPTQCGMTATAGAQACPEWLATQGLRHRAVYFGPGLFWTLQWRELGVLLAVSAFVGLFSFWWLRRRVL